MVAVTYLPLMFYALSLGFLSMYLKHMEKKYFIFSISCIVTGSFTSALLFYDLTTPWLFFLAIVTSLIGDLFMAEKISLTDQRLIDGIIAFGVAHITYIYAYYRLTTTFNWFLVFVIFIIGLALFVFIITNMRIKGFILIASCIYAILLISLLTVILNLALTSNIPELLMITAIPGIVLFISSDVLIIVNEYKHDINNAQEIIAITYIFAQILLQLTPLILGWK
ncbi:MAG: lysoplasmalogenase family protein [Candidatus Kariarchaeaceae archaeon]|jgi:uncharacterized membrane protein YhhN